MKIIHQQGFSTEERASYRPTIYRNVLDSAQAIVLAMRNIGLDPVSFSNRVGNHVFRHTPLLIVPF
jgi:guanine nucleotide-binding protein subunit alpha